jgi:hypothetical protein
MKFINTIKNRVQQLSGNGFLGSLIAAVFLLLLFIALTSPLWIIGLGYWFLTNMID